MGPEAIFPSPELTLYQKTPETKPHCLKSLEKMLCRVLSGEGNAVESISGTGHTGGFTPLKTLVYLPRADHEDKAWDTLSSRKEGCVGMMEELQKSLGPECQEEVQPGEGESFGVSLPSFSHTQTPAFIMATFLCSPYLNHFPSRTPCPSIPQNSDLTTGSLGDFPGPKSPSPSPFTFLPRKESGDLLAGAQGERNGAGT